MSLRMLVIAVAVLAIAVQGCGGSEDAKTISKADFTAGSEEICTKAVGTQATKYEEIVSAAEGKQVAPADGRAAEQELADVVASSVENMVAEFEDLGVPEGKQEAVSQMLEKYEQGARETKADPQAFLTAKAFIPADKGAEKLGLAKCENI